MDRAAALHALRRADRVAGRTVPGVRGPAARVRERPRSNWLRRGGPQVRPCLEGARAAAARRRGIAARCRTCASARRGGAHVRTVRPRPATRAWPQSCGTACARACRRVGAPMRAAARANARRTPAWQFGGRAAHDPWGVPRDGSGASHGRGDRRRLHDRRHRGDRRDRPSCRRRTPRRGDCVRPRAPPGLVSRSPSRVRQQRNLAGSGRGEAAAARPETDDALGVVRATGEAPMQLHVKGKNRTLFFSRMGTSRERTSW